MSWLGLLSCSVKSMDLDRRKPGFDLSLGSVVIYCLCV